MKPTTGQDAYAKLRASYETAERARWVGGKRVLGRSYRHSLPVTSDDTRIDIRVPARLRQNSTDDRDADTCAIICVILFSVASLCEFIAMLQ
jgi:hypothetical protein